MDIVSVAASLTALITIAIQSTKVISQALQQIRDRPIRVQRLVTKADVLQQTLDQLRTLITDADSISGSNVSAFFTNLQRLVETCTAELNRITRKLVCLQEAIGGKHVRRAWGLLKALLKERDLEDMWTVLQSHTETLNSQLIIIGTRLGIDHTQRFKQLDSVLGSSSQENTVKLDRLGGGVAKHVQYQVVECFDRLGESLDLRHISHQEIINESGKQQVKALNLLDNNLSGLRSDFASRFDLMGQQNKFYNQASSQAANHLSAKLESLSQVSQEQSETMIQLLRQIQQQNNPHRAEGPTAASIKTQRDAPAQASSSNHHHHVDGNTTDAIDRLCLLASKKPQTVSSDEAQSIIEDLESILNIVIAKEEEAVRQQRFSTKHKRDQYNYFPVSGCELRYCRDAKRVRKILSASQSISVNKKIISGGRMPLMKGRTTSRSGSREYRTEYGTIRVNYTFKQAVQVPESPGQEQELASLEVTEIFLGSFSLLPAKKSEHQTKISTSFCQRTMDEGYSILHPLMSFCSVIPDNSSVFKVVRTGDVSALIELFSTGVAALTDCDTEGRSLLNYALNSLNITISAFLIDNGADVNAVEQCIDPKFWNCPLLQHLQFWNDLVYDGSRNLEAQQLLLNAEADPTVCMNPSSGCSVFMGVVRYSSIETVRVYMNLTSSLINLEDTDALGKTALLIVLDGLVDGGVPWKHILDNAVFLLDHGADITARDHIGKGVFHYLFCHRYNCWWDKGPIWSTEPATWFGNEGLLAVLRLLLTRGADVHAIDTNGCSITQAASEAGSGAVWYGALFDADFDAEEIFAYFYERVPEARCSCGKPRAQRRTVDRGYSGELRVEFLPDCTHCKDFSESRKAYDEASSISYRERSGGAFPVPQGVTEQGSHEDWGIEDSDKTVLEGAATLILEGAW